MRAGFSLPGLISNWTTFLAGTAAALGMASLAWRLGIRVRRLLDGSRRQSPGSGLAALGLGFAGLATLALGLGLTGLLYPPPRPLAVALLGALALREGVRLRDRLSAPAFLKEVSLPTRLILGFALLLSIVSIFNIEMAWDALTYHLRLPTFYLYRHKIYDVWHHYYAPFPSLVEMLYLLGLGVQGEHAARMLNALFGLLLLLATRSLARLLGSPGSLAMIPVAVSPLVLMLLGRAYIDLGFAFFAALSLIALIRWRIFGSGVSLAESALLAGCAMGSKYIGVLVIPAFLAAAGPLLFGRIRGRPAWSAAPALAPLCCLLPLAPWLAKNFLFTGNPVSPMLGNLFGTHEILHPDMVTIFGAGFRPLELLRAVPGRLHNLIFHDALVDGPLGPAAAGALPLLLFKPPSANLIFLRRAVLGYTFTWLLLCPDARFYLPVLPPLAVLIEAAALKALTLPLRVRLPLRALAEAGLCAGALFAGANIWIFFAPFSMLLGLQTESSILRVGLPPPPFHFYAREHINAHVPRQDRILHLCNFSTYYIERECIADFRFGEAHISRLIRTGGDTEGIARKLKQRGIRWLLHANINTRQYLNVPGFFAVSENGWAHFKDLLARRAEVAWQTDGYVLFRLRPPGSPQALPVLPIYEAIAFHSADLDLAKGRVGEALQRYLSPPELLADVGSTYVRRADAYMLMPDFLRAADSFAAALDRGSDNPRVNLGLAQAALALERPAAGLEHARRAFAQNPYSGQAAAILAVTYWSLGESAKARAQLEIARRLAPERTEFRDLARRWALAVEASPAAAAPE